MHNLFHKTGSPEVAEGKYLGLEAGSLFEAGAKHTAEEISQQPLLWEQTWRLMIERRDSIRDFLSKAFAESDIQIIITGAGSSAFIGMALEGPMQAVWQKNCRAVATTELLAHPDHYFSAKPTLLISFARSGDSPESLAAVRLAETFCPTVFNFIISCNSKGRLAVENENERSYLFLLPAAAEDQGLAMTGSFTTMLFTGMLLLRLDQVDTLYDQIESLCNYGNKIIHEYAPALRNLAQIDFTRAVFLGSGPLKAIASESALKVQELTDGRIVCKDDSFLGFRHGPKAVINSSTLLVYLFSNDQYVNRYETDLVNSINAGEKGIFRLGIEETEQVSRNLDLSIELNGNDIKLEEDFLAVVSVLPAQILGFFKSLALEMRPDSPSKNQTITRVVRGVQIYPYKKYDS